MNRQLSSQDMQLLSTYLDNQLSSRERRELETRLRSDASLQTHLESLRRTRGLLRGLPRRRVPHNFILTRAMVQEHRLPRLFPVFSFTSAIATFLLILSFFTQLLPFTNRTVAFSAPAPAAEAQKAVSDSAKTTPMIIQWGNASNTPEAKGGGAGDTLSPTLTPEPVTLQAIPSTKTAEKSSANTQTSQPPSTTTTGPDLGAPRQSVTASTAPTLAPTRPPTATALPPTPSQAPTQPAVVTSPQENGGPILGIRPTGEQGIRIDGRELQATPAANAAFPSSNWLVQLSLAIIALATGITAILLWRKSRA